jgi:translation elongation factor EF-G
MPLSILVTRPSATSQLWFAREAADAVTGSPAVHAEPSEGGLMLHGMTELDLEMVCDELKKRYPDLRLGNPEVAYVEGEKLLEPYYLATVDTPEDFMGNVVGDLSSRRGLIVEMDDCPTGKTIKAEVPVAECFGYTTTLRHLTNGKGHYKLKFIGYRPAPGYPSGGEPLNVA